MMLTPKEEAKELCNKFLRTYKVSLYPPFNSASQEAKQCALIAVDEVLKSHYEIISVANLSMIDHYKEVKQELEKL